MNEQEAHGRSDVDDPTTRRSARRALLRHPAFLLAALLPTLTAIIGLFAGELTSSALLLAVVWPLWLAFAWLAPRLGWVRHTLAQRRAKRSERIARIRERATLRALSPAMTERYIALKFKVHEILRSTPAQTPTSLPIDMLHRHLRGLPELSLKLLAELSHVERLLASSDEIDLYRQLDTLELELARATSDRIRDAKRARRDILLRRRRQLARAREHREILTTRLAMIEDVLEWLRESALFVEDPAWFEARLNDLTLALDGADAATRLFEVPSGETPALPASSSSAATEPVYAYTPGRASAPPV